MHGSRSLGWYLLGLLACSGCGSAEQPGASATAASGQAAVSSPEAAAATPVEAVQKFLTAVKAGDDELAGQLLTPLAREKTAERDLMVAPPGSETATFTVGDAEASGEDGAHVASEWTDIDETGNPHTDAIVWILRKEPEGWRIAGMGTKLFEDAPPLFLNFENPDDMIRKQQLAEQEMQRRAQLETPLQAQSPDPNKEINR